MFDQILPALDGVRGGWTGGVREYLVAELDRDLAWAQAALGEAVRALDRAAQSRHRVAFCALPASEQRAVLAAHLEARDPADGEPALVRVAMEGHYAARTAALRENWSAIGFDVDPNVNDPITARVSTIASEALRDRYDTIVIGAGAGGGVLAAELAAGGQRVLLLERAERRSDAELRGDHLHGKRLSVYAPSAGPGAGHPREIETGEGPPRTVDGDESPWEWGLCAMCLGGGTRLWQAMAWRFPPEDFAMATRYGVPHASTLADWPFGYDELAPYYERVEHELGVCGDGTFADRLPRRRGYPMPPLAGDALGEALGRWSARLGWRTGPIPFAINSVPHDGRAACVRCPQCVGHTCPVDAKNGSMIAIRRAAGRENCDLLTGAQALRLAPRHGGGGVDVTIGLDGNGGPRTRRVWGDRVAVCAGAIETPRLLQVSGLGNAHVGRHLHSHTIHLQLGLAREAIGDFRGPGHSIATLDFVHAEGSPYGGGVLFDAPSMLPLGVAAAARLFGRPSWGEGHRRWMREGRRHLIGAMGIGQDVPAGDSRVAISARIRDRWGQPVARIRNPTHPAAEEVRSFLAARCGQWLRAGECVVGPALISGIALAEHAAGSCRMGEDPSSAACDPHGRLFGEPDVFVCDASLHPSNGSVNPGLTVMANALRVGEAMLKAG